MKLGREGNGVGEGGLVIINPSPSSHGYKEAWHVGEDHLDFGLYVDWQQWEVVTRQRLTDARPNPPHKFNLTRSDIRLGGIPFAVPKRGRAVGRDGGPFFEFVVHNEALGINLLIADVPGASPSWANVRVTLHGRFFLQKGDARYGYQLITAVIEELGGHVRRSELSRIDIALDLPEIGMDAFLGPYQSGHYVTRSNVRETYKSGGETLYFGKAQSQVRCCIYDKLSDAREKKTLNLMCKRRWGGETPSCATRVEFRVRRQALKRAGIDSVEDLFEKEGDLLQYLCTRWLRFTDGPLDRENRNQARIDTLPLWADVHDRFVEGVGGLSGKPLAPLPKQPVSMVQWGKQAVGVVFSAAKAEERSLKSLGAFKAYAIDLMAPYASEKLPIISRGEEGGSSK